MYAHHNEECEAAHSLYVPSVLDLHNGPERRPRLPTNPPNLANRRGDSGSAAQSRRDTGGNAESNPRNARCE